MMDNFNFKKFTSEAATAFSRAVQYTEEKLGSAEKTELDAHYENLAARADKTRIWTEKILRQSEAVIQPNPTARLEEFVNDKLGQFDSTMKPIRQRQTNHEILGQYMIDAGNEFGPGTAYGSALVKCGQTEVKIGREEIEYIRKSNAALLAPLQTFLDGDMKTIQKERKILEAKRLDLDYNKNRLKKAKSQEAVTNAEAELRVAQSEFDRQTEITKLLLEGISSAHANHLRCLNDYVESQMTYYGQCYRLMQELQKDLASNALAGTGNLSNNMYPNIPTQNGGNDAGGKKARVLYDYDAADAKELSLLADEVIIVVNTVNNDWVVAERGSQRGRVPLTYIEYIN